MTPSVQNDPLVYATTLTFRALNIKYGLKGVRACVHAPLWSMEFFCKGCMEGCNMQAHFILFKFGHKFLTDHASGAFQR